MEFLIKNIANWIRQWQDKPLTRRDGAIIFLAVAGVIAVVLLFLPPYNVSDVNWCEDPNQSVKVSGRLATRFLGTSVGDEEIQIKIFPVGEDRPIAPEKIARTTTDGMFAVTFSPPLLSTYKNYLINTAYKNYILSVWERWQISDFKMGDLSQCPTQ